MMYTLATLTLATLVGNTHAKLGSSSSRHHHHQHRDLEPSSSSTTTTEQQQRKLLTFPTNKWWYCIEMSKCVLDCEGCMGALKPAVDQSKEDLIAQLQAEIADLESEGGGDYRRRMYTVNGMEVMAVLPDGTVDTVTLYDSETSCQASVLREPTDPVMTWQPDGHAEPEPVVWTGDAHVPVPVTAGCPYTAGHDCTDLKCCADNTVCTPSTRNGSDRWFCGAEVFHDVGGAQCPTRGHDCTTVQCCSDGSGCNLYTGETVLGVAVHGKYYCDKPNVHVVADTEAACDTTRGHDCTVSQCCADGTSCNLYVAKENDITLGVSGRYYCDKPVVHNAELPVHNVEPTLPGLGGTCTHTRKCAGDLVCAPSALNGSDQYFCVTATIVWQHDGHDDHDHGTDPNPTQTWVGDGHVHSDPTDPVPTEPEPVVWYHDGHSPCDDVTQAQIDLLQGELDAIKDELVSAKAELEDLLVDCVVAENELNEIIANCDVLEVNITSAEAVVDDAETIDKLLKIAELELALEAARDKIAMLSTSQEQFLLEMQAQGEALVAIVAEHEALVNATQDALDSGEEMYQDIKDEWPLPDTWTMSCLEECPEGLVTCIQDPCETDENTCTVDEICVPDYCGGCNVKCVVNLEFDRA